MASAGFVVRIGHRARNLPYSVDIILPRIEDAANPGPPLENPRVSGRVLDIVPPTNDGRHEKLGQFLNEWSHLEGTVVFVIAGLLNIDHHCSRLIMSTLGTKQIIDLVVGLALMKLKEPNALVTLAERIGKLNTKRNIIVHGHWVLEANLLVKNGDAAIGCQFLREVAPTDPREAEAMKDFRNQKQRVRYSFTLKRMEAATRDIRVLTDAFVTFNKATKLEPASPTERQ